MPEKVGNTVKRVRSERMLKLARESSLRFREKFLGRTMTVLWEQRVDGDWVGLTDNYIRVVASGDEPLKNRVTETRLAGFRI